MLQQEKVSKTRQLSSAETSYLEATLKRSNRGEPRPFNKTFETQNPASFRYRLHAVPAGPRLTLDITSRVWRNSPVNSDRTCKVRKKLRCKSPWQSFVSITPLNWHTNSPAKGTFRRSIPPGRGLD